MSDPRLTLGPWLSQQNTPSLRIPSIARSRISCVPRGGSRSSVSMNPLATNPVLSPSSNAGSARGRRTWYSSVPPVPVSRPRRPGSSSACNGRRSSWHPTRPSRHSWPTSSGKCCRTTLSNTSFRITITTSRKRISRKPIPISKKTAPSTMTWSVCGTRRHPTCCLAGMSWWWPRSHASTDWVLRSLTWIVRCSWTWGWRCLAMRCCGCWSTCSTTAMTWLSPGAPSGYAATPSRSSRPTKSWLFASNSSVTR
ncbi:Uncharacterised protein [Mycobacteroides abscessus subsp. abscessus]|nr:Uncharacterised protein [Mycobacteroides abscessus subsp. abscessus]